MLFRKKPIFAVGESVLARRANNKMGNYVPCTIIKVHQYDLSHPNVAIPQTRRTGDVFVKLITLGALPPTTYTYDVRYDDGLKDIELTSDCI